MHMCAIGYYKEQSVLIPVRVSATYWLACFRLFQFFLFNDTHKTKFVKNTGVTCIIDIFTILT